MDFKEKYLLAKKNGLADRFRGDEISRRIAKVYPENAQTALLMNTLKSVINGSIDFTEWDAYQAFREAVKAEVDAEIAAINGGTI